MKSRPQPDPSEAPIFYLVSAAGNPDYGDELVTRAWLDMLTELHPAAEVWLDCPHPGRASHLFRRTHPHLYVTSTLWELASLSTSTGQSLDEDQIARYVRELGTPRIDLGLYALRDVTSVHILGGAYSAERQRGFYEVVAAVAALRREFGIRAFATGLGMQAPTVESSRALSRLFDAFDYVEARDRETADEIGGDHGLDDLFLALGSPRLVYDNDPEPQRIVLMQGDRRTWADADAIRSIEGFLSHAPDDEIAFVEAVPPDDARYITDTCPDARFYSFGNIWFDGLPARVDQSWLTTRPSAHLLAAAVGAAGTAIVGDDALDVRGHGALLELGTGWGVATAGTIAEPTVDHTFAERARDHAATKRRLAARLYGAR